MSTIWTWVKVKLSCMYCGVNVKTLAPLGAVALGICPKCEPTRAAKRLKI